MINEHPNLLYCLAQGDMNGFVSLYGSTGNLINTCGMIYGDGFSPDKIDQLIKALDVKLIVSTHPVFRELARSLGW